MLFDLLKARRSIRKFQDREVEAEKLDVILKSALLAPTSRGRRPWEFIVVRDKEMLSKLALCREYGSQFLAGAPLAVVVAANRKSCDVWVEDAAIAAFSLQLAAQSLGLGSCWVQVRERFHTEEEAAEDYIRSFLHIPAQLSVACMIAVGYPDEVKRAYDENELPLEKIHYNAY